MTDALPINPGDKVWTLDGLNRPYQCEVERLFTSEGCWYVQLNFGVKGGLIVRPLVDVHRDLESAKITAANLTKKETVNIVERPMYLPSDAEIKAVKKIALAAFGKDEVVDHPAHYGGEENIYEAIKVIEAWNLNFNLGNAVKYIARAGKKGDLVEDLKKAAWYLEREIDNLKEAASGNSDRPA